MSLKWLPQNGRIMRKVGLSSSLSFSPFLDLGICTPSGWQKLVCLCQRTETRMRVVIIREWMKYERKGAILHLHKWIVAYLVFHWVIVDLFGTVRTQSANSSEVGMKRINCTIGQDCERTQYKYGHKQPTVHPASSCVFDVSVCRVKVKWAILWIANF